MSETDFYKYYSGFEQLEGDFLVYFMQESIRLISSEESYSQYSPKDRMLSFYFTFFEQLTLNRSLVLYLLDGKKSALPNLKKLWPLRKVYQHFMSGLGITEPLMEINNENSEKIEKFRNKGIEEVFWGHLLATLKFWMEDTSSSFEKTDIFIEKSLDTSFALLEVQPLKKILDLGKFLFKEKFKTN
ncbi:TetR family transcriptional regulator C-terminal domain-containing protein [Chryseobacterium sp.]|uniref:TetR family transcriptional regulator C-terminal domain-containing protein n=1 Tax=Chryseobacterium sp. TaxID=1871047 RepID=UPI0011C7A723|nr:TetR family transcriptional regulator C-terminal domain-containing protein [Chryseobacterium sp.]TXF79136.1 TetR/AcrR family transcriptional regulator [Chryseobacterium sp.]